MLQMGNILINEVTTKGGNEPAIWNNLEQSYMTVPYWESRCEIQHWAEELVGGFEVLLRVR